MELYTVNSEYINYLKEFESHIWDNEEKGRLRPYTGIVLDIGNIKYYAPLSSPKQKHQKMVDRIDFIRLEYKGKLIAVINLNNMIPVSDKFISKIDIRNLEDQDYKNLLNVEMIDIRRKQSTILKNAISIYNKTTKFRSEEKNTKLVAICFDFLTLEQKLNIYIQNQK